MSELISCNGKPVHVLGDGNYRDYLHRQGAGGDDLCGSLPPGHDDMMCSLRVTTWEASGLVVYDEKELGERLEDAWAHEATIMHATYGRNALDQSRGTCWIHGTCQAAMQLIDLQGGTEYRELSPASVAYHCYWNFGVNGGYPAKGVSEFQEHGACDLSYWPENGFSRSYDTDESQANRVYNWLDEVVLVGDGEEAFIKLLSAHVQGKPGGASFNWWNHYVCSCWGRLNGKELQLGIRNSWGNNGYGDKGFGLLSGSRKYPAWACVFLRMRQSRKGPSK